MVPGKLAFGQEKAKMVLPGSRRRHDRGCRLPSAADHGYAGGNGDVDVGSETVDAVIHHREPATGVKKVRGISHVCELQALDRALVGGGEFTVVFESDGAGLTLGERLGKIHPHQILLRDAFDGERLSSGVEHARTQGIVQFEAGGADVVERGEAQARGGDQVMRLGIQLGVDGIAIHLNPRLFRGESRQGQA
jgi:hypothetical protein